MAVLETTKVGEAHGLSARLEQRHMNMKTSISFLEDYSISITRSQTSFNSTPLFLPRNPLQ
jgi:hypothetical protein